MKRVEGAAKKRNREAIAMDGKVTMRNVKTLNDGN